jgi:ribonuclease HII
VPLIAGVDDAGRGPVIGPLVIAGILIRDDQIPRLRSLGLKDSKLLTPAQRQRLDKEIKEIVVKYAYVDLNPDEIDKVVMARVKLRRLNLLEAQAMARVINELKPDVAYVDASDILEERFGKQIKELLPFNVTIISEHNADVKYPVVSAASILAKVRRDQYIAKLKEIYGDIGSGYPHDEKTIRFLSNWVRQHGSFPDFVRKSWKTIRTLEAEIKGKQTQL